MMLMIIDLQIINKYLTNILLFVFFFTGSCGVPDMTSISDIDEDVINRNLQTRYSESYIYVSFLLDTRTQNSLF